MKVARSSIITPSRSLVALSSLDYQAEAACIETMSMKSCAVQGASVILTGYTACSPIISPSHQRFTSSGVTVIDVLI